MTRKKMPDLQQAGTADRTNEFARLVLELAATNPERLRAFGDEMTAKDRRSRYPNK